MPHDAAMEADGPVHVVFVTMCGMGSGANRIRVPIYVSAPCISMFPWAFRLPGSHLTLVLAMIVSKSHCQGWPRLYFTGSHTSFYCIIWTAPALIRCQR